MRTAAPRFLTGIDMYYSLVPFQLLRLAAKGRIQLPKLQKRTFKRGLDELERHSCAAMTA